jgi:heme exporter protein D
MSAYFEMGGYAAYVWPSYALAVVVLAGILTASLRAMRTREAQLKVLQASRPHRGSRAARAGKPAEEATSADA